MAGGGSDDYEKSGWAAEIGNNKQRSNPFGLAPIFFWESQTFFIGIDGLDAALAADGDKREVFCSRRANQRGFGLLFGAII